MPAEEYYKRRKDQQPIGGFKDSTGEYKAKLLQLQVKFRLNTIAVLMKKLIDDAFLFESREKFMESTQRAHDNMRRINERRRSWNYWFLGLNILLSLILLYAIFW